MVGDAYGQVFRPQCGTLRGTISDPYGQPADAMSADAATGTIAIANIFGPEAPTAVSRSARSRPAAPKNLTNPNMYEVVGVAMSKGGDCWASAIDAKTAPI